jgi:hypothetical protein
MNYKSFLPLCLIATSMVIWLTGCSKASQQRAEQPSIQGRWSGFEQGSSEKITIVYTSNQFAYFDATSNKLGSGTFVENRTVQPVQMDLTFEHMLSPEYEGKVGLALYEILSNRLTIAGCEPGSGQRPTNLVASDGVRVFNLTRD